MSVTIAHTDPCETISALPGLDGGNPVDFLASLGVLITLTNAIGGTQVLMSWTCDAGTWHPRIHGIREDTDTVSTVARQLKCPFVPAPEAESRRATAQKGFDDARKKLRKAKDSLKKSNVRGQDRATAEARSIAPLREELNKTRAEWLEALRACVPSLEMALGKHLNATGSEFRETAKTALQQASLRERGIVDLLAAFGSDACLLSNSPQMEATPFCFITGSGHQYFLDTARQLYALIDSQRLREALFENAEPRDEKLSMRWDPNEDRRYAVMWSDPTASDNKAKTNWAKNLLAYRGLALLPSFPTRRGLASTGWSLLRPITWSWPIWRGPLSVSVVKSVLAHPILTADNIDSRQLVEVGFTSIFRSSRIQVGNPPLHKINFTPACRIA